MPHNTLEKGALDKLLYSLGIPSARMHRSFEHFDFSEESRLILVFGPMGSGKTEFAARVWRDSQVALNKLPTIKKITTTPSGADRRRIFVIRNRLDLGRFKNAPADSLSYRGGSVRCGSAIAHIEDSFDLERIIKAHPDYGTWIIDEASFYDERLVFVIDKEVQEYKKVFICPTLMLNYRRTLFNSTARFLLEHATDIITLAAYCEHADCLSNAEYSYRYYMIDDQECPALYFDPLIVIGGSEKKEGDVEPNYAVRCAAHHALPAREYTIMTLKHLGKLAAHGDYQPLTVEIERLHQDVKKSALYRDLHERYSNQEELYTLSMNALKVGSLAERALIYLFAEENLIDEYHLRSYVDSLTLNSDYLARTLSNNGRIIKF